MTIFSLQITAMAAMLCDHVGYAFCGNSLPMRCIGRLAFPIYAFMMAEGFRHMKNESDRIRKHLRFYIICMLVSEFCYDLFVYRTLTFEDAMSGQSALVTLLLGFTGLVIIHRFRVNGFISVLTALLTAAASYILRANYRFAGVLLIYAFYFYLSDMEGKTYLQRLGELFLIFFCYLALYHWTSNGFCSFAEYIGKLTPRICCLYASPAGCVLLLADYTGKRGPVYPGFRVFYKWFFPVHMLILGLLRRL